MAKRKRVEEQTETPDRHQPPKRTRCHGPDYFNGLSDELVLRALSFLPLIDLLTAEQVCKRFRRLASDNEIWREKFYNQFVRPRAKRLPGLRSLSENERERRALYYAAKSARWLEHSSKADGERDWKRRYKVKLNWSRGLCKAHEVTLDCPVRPRIMVKVFRGIIFTASETGLRTYSQRARPQLLNAFYWETDGRRPTALTVELRGTKTLVAVGFSDGSISICTSDEASRIEHEFTCPSSCEAAVSSVAVAWPYLLCMRQSQTICLYQMQRGLDAQGKAIELTSLHSEAILSPVSLSIREVSSTLIASIAYSFTGLNSGWCLGLQEIRLSLKGEILQSRLTSTVETPLNSTPLIPPSLLKPKLVSRAASTGPLPLHPQLMHPPNTLSHSGCYILAGLSDNTLMVYTVTSTDESLDISGGRRLWGHTSSVSGTDVSDRGKALSISAKGDEIRVWDLESLLSKYEAGYARTSTELKPLSASPRAPNVGDGALEQALLRRGNGLGLAWHEVKSELLLRKEKNDTASCARHWVGFDDEQVVVLGEKGSHQILSCYDFA